MSSLPDDIILNILSRLPVKDLLRFRCVCKPWKLLIRTPDFVKMQLNHSLENENENENEISLLISGLGRICTIDYINDNDSSLKGYEMYYPFKYPDCYVKISGTCNGLVCIAIDIENIFCIWNPSTQEYKKIPTLAKPFEVSRSRTSGVFGFGYDCKTEDYKFVRIWGYDLFDSEVNVYSLRSNSWKRDRTNPFNKLCFGFGDGVFLNGAIHWIARSNSSFDSEELSLSITLSTAKVVVASLNIGDETFKVVPQPEDFNTKCSCSLVVLGGCLCLVVMRRQVYADVYADIWVMKDYGASESWAKLFTFSQQTVIGSFRFLMPMHSFKNGEILLEKDHKTLVLYNPEYETARILKVHGVPITYGGETFVRSLVSPNLSITYKKKLKNKKKRKKNKKRC